MTEIINKLSPETIVKAAELKERLTNRSAQRWHDPEARESEFLQMIKTFDGDLLTKPQMTDILGWTPGTVSRYLQKFMRQGRITAKKVGKTAWRYYCHDQPVPKDERTIRTRVDKKVTVKKPAPQVEAIHAQLAQTNQKAHAERTAGQRAFIERVELAVWDYLRDAKTDEALTSFVGLQNFGRHLRANYSVQDDKE